MTEQSFQQYLRIELTRQLGLRVWRQPSGKIPTRKNAYVKAAPKGFADLSGIVAPEGWRIEIEAKGADTRISKAQIRRRQWIQEQGGIALIVRGPDVDQAVKNIAEAIAVRRARG